MRRISHHTYATVFGVVYLGVISNLLLAAATLPLLLLLITTNPVDSWLFIAVCAPLLAPALTGVFTAFAEHHSGGAGPFAAFWAGYRATWRRAVLIGLLATAVLVVVVVDLRFAALIPLGALLAPLLVVTAALVVVVALLALTGLAEVPTARLRSLFSAAGMLGLRRWYLSAASLVLVGIQVAIFTNAPVIGIGLSASAVLFALWSNCRYTLRSVLNLEPSDTPSVPVRG